MNPLSKHAIVRGSQRGIRSDQINSILDYGERRKKPGGAYEYYLPDKTIQRVINQLRKQIHTFEKARNKAIVVSSDGEVITVYPNR